MAKKTGQRANSKQVKSVAESETSEEPSQALAAAPTTSTSAQEDQAEDPSLVFTIPVDSCLEKPAQESNNVEDNNEEDEDSDTTVVTQTCATNQLLTSLDVTSKDAGYYPVEKILDCRIKSDGKREFKIKWAGFNNCHNSWQPEANLDGCVQTLKKFLKDNPHFGRTTKLKQRVGAHGEGHTFNEDNWVDLDYLLETIETRRNCNTYKSDLEVKILNHESKIDRSKDAIYVVAEYHHCFVLLFRADTASAIIADGSNAFLGNEMIRTHLKMIIGGDISTTATEFLHQSGVDHCASSAASIALEFLRLYKSRELLDKDGWPTKLYIPLGQHHSIVAQFHKFETERICARDENLKKRVFHKCQICGRAFQTTNRRSISLHEMHCRKRHSGQQDLTTQGDAL